MKILSTNGKSANIYNFTGRHCRAKTAAQSKLDVKARLFHATRLATGYGQSPVGHFCQVLSKEPENSEIFCLIWSKKSWIFCSIFLEIELSRLVAGVRRRGYGTPATKNISYWFFFLANQREAHRGFGRRGFQGPGVHVFCDTSSLVINYTVLSEFLPVFFKREPYPGRLIDWGLCTSDAQLRDSCDRYRK